MDKNTITGLILIAAVLIGFSWYNTNQERNLQQIPQTEQSNTPDAQNKKSITAQQALNQKAAADSADIFFAATKGKQTMWCLATIR